VSLLLVGAVAVAFLVPAVVGCTLSGHDEPRVAGIAREMAMRRDLAVPRLDGKPFLEYPPLGYVGPALVCGLFPTAPEWALILPSALFGIATALVTTWLGFQIGGARLGITAGLLLVTMAGFFEVHHQLLVDPALVFFVTLALACFHAGVVAERWRWPAFAAAFLATGCAFLSKGLIGVAIPLAVSGAFLLLNRSAVRTLLGPILATAPLIAAPLGVWVFALYRENALDALHDVMSQSVHRFSSDAADHAHGPTYYLGPLAYRFAPWVLFPVAGLFLLRRVPAEERRAILRDARFPAVWFGVVVFALHVASAKRTLYLAPLDPAVALLAAVAWSRIRLAKAISPNVERGAFALAGGILFGLYVFLVLPGERLETYGPVVELAGTLRRDRPVLLHRPSEGLMGAFVYYLGETFPVARTPEELKRELAARGPCLVVSERGPGAVLPAPDELVPSLRRIGEDTVHRQTVSIYADEMASDDGATTLPHTVVPTPKRG